VWSGRGPNESQLPLPSSTTQPYTPHSSFTYQMVQTQMILIHTRPCSTNSIVCKCLLPSSDGLRATCLSDSRESLQMVSVLGCHRVQFRDLVVLIYINDLTHCSPSRSAKLLMFADDVLLYKPITTRSDLIAFQNDVDTTGHWSLLNHLSLNTNKTKFMLISRSKHYSQCPHILLDGINLEQVFHFKYLRVWISTGPSISCRSPARCAGSWAIHTFRTFSPSLFTICYYDPLQSPGFAHSRSRMYHLRPPL